MGSQTTVFFKKIKFFSFRILRIKIVDLKTPILYNKAYVEERRYENTCTHSAFSQGFTIQVQPSSAFQKSIY